VRPARRIATVPPYLFAELDRRRAEVEARGVDVIPLGIGDPDLPTPEPVVARLQAEAARPANHRYPDYEGSRSFREACAAYMARRFGVELDPRTPPDGEVLALIGAKEGLAHLVWAFVDPGDVALCPDPGYPVYAVHTRFAGGEPYPLPLREERGFLPDLGAVPPAVARRAKILFLNYPNNPTAAVADLAFFEEAVAFCRRYDILLCHDAAYVEIGYDGYRAPSVLQVPGAKDVAVEFHSLSKPFNMTGWRIGFACGSREAIRALSVVKSNTDSGPFTAVQAAAEEALRLPPEVLDRQLEVYRRRRDLMVDALRRAGIAARSPQATIYLWCPVPRGETSAGFAARLLEEAGVFVTPGTGYGPHGEGYFRISLTCPDDRLEEAARRIGTLGGR
jgi:LL-diaminopimelate aminotransferase